MKFKERQRRAARAEALLRPQAAPPGQPGRALAAPATGSLFPRHCACGVELHNLDEATEHECKPK